MKDFNIQKDKAIHSLLFVANSLTKPDCHRVYKILYFAEQKHLCKYGRPISCDTYNKMQYGPVPSFIKNIVDEQTIGLEEVVAKYNRFYIKPLQEVNLDYLSETDIECLKEAIEENKNLSFKELTEKSHDYAYNNSSWVINYVDIAKAGGVTEEMKDFINQQRENNNLVLL